MRKLFSFLPGRVWFFVLLSACVLAPSGASGASADPGWKVSAQAAYETGTYGTGTRIDTLYVPLTVKSYFDKGDISLTVPYIYQEGNAQVAFQDGMVFKTKPGGAAPVTAHSGIGDVIIKGGLYLLNEDERQPVGLTLAGKIKIPTADETNGLGTGEFDEGVGLELSKRIQPELTFFADIYYTFIGKPKGTGLKDRVSFDIGLENRITPVLYSSVFYEESTALMRGEPDPKDIAVNLEYKVSKTQSVFCGATLGLTESSPDWGLSAGFSYGF